MADPYQQPPNAFAPKPPMTPQGQQVNPYDIYRKQAEQKAQANQMTQGNALQRRFAQIGGGPSGARIKMEQDMQRTGAADLNDQIQGINAQEAQANVQADQFNRQFGLENTKALAGIDMARRQQALDELGQNYNMVNEMSKSPMSWERQYQEINRAGNYLNSQPGAGGFGDYLQGIQALQNPMIRRLQMTPQGQPAQGVANG